MTESIKGTRPPSPAVAPKTEKARRETKSEEQGSPPIEDKVTAQAINDARREVDAAAKEVRELDAALSAPPQTERAPRESIRSERSASPPPEPFREELEVEGTSGEIDIGEIDVDSSEPPIRTAEEATRVAERVSREIAANPSQALAVNINIAAVRALFS